MLWLLRPSLPLLTVLAASVLSCPRGSISGFAPLRQSSNRTTASLALSHR